MRIRIFALSVLACCGTMFVGCSGPRVAPAHELRIAFSSDPASLSPLVAFEQDEIAYDQLWCQTLVGNDARGRPRPILVERVPTRRNGDVSADGMRITYHLRRNVRFADGVPFTSADVAFTYRAIFDAANFAAGIENYRRIASLATPDAHTVIVRLTKPWGAAVRVLFGQADFAYGILPKHAFATTRVTGTAWDDAPFGTGPFHVTAWHRGDRIDLAANPYYAPAPKLARIVLRIIPNRISAFAALRTHEVDVASLIPDTVVQARAIDGMRILDVPENGLGAMYLQTASGPTSDLRVRRAIADALDPALLAKGWHQAYPLATSLFPPPVVTWRSVATPPYSNDLSEAGRELDAAGWTMADGTRVKDGEPLVLVEAVNAETAIGPRVAVLVQERLARIGIRVTIKASPQKVFTAPDGPLRTGHFSLIFAFLIGGADPEQSINLRCADAQPGGGNYARYCSRRLEALYTDQTSTTDEARRDRDFDAIARLVHDDVPLVPLYDETYFEGVSSRVTGYGKDMLRFPVRAESWDTR